MKQTSHAKNWLRGGQIVDHNIRMFKQTAKRVFFATLIISVGYIVIYTAINTTANDRKLAANHYYSKLMTYIGITKGINTILFQGRSIALTHPKVANSKTFIDASRRINGVVLIAFLQSLFLNFVIYILISWYIRRRGKAEQADKFLRGGKLVKNDEFKKTLTNKQINQDLSLGVVPILKDSETIHIEISGAPGTGKSQTLKHLIKNIKERGDRAIIYSSSTEFVAEFYDQDKDIILNPLDDRSPAWSLWNEAHEVYHYDDIAAALIPEEENGQNDPFWTKTARSLLSNAARKLKDKGEYSTKLLYDKLLAISLKEIADLVKNTESATIFADGVEKTALGVRSTLLSNLASFKFLSNDEDGFSIRNWVKDECNNGCVFITSIADQHEVLKPLISCWVDIFASSMLSMSEDRNRRIWLVIDELPSLHKLKSLGKILAESRKYGGCVVLGYQSYSKIEEVYGDKGAKTLSDLTATKVFFRSNNDYNAKHASSELGKEEIKATSENLAMGAHTMRDSVSITESEKLRELVLPTQIFNLNDLHGFYRLPGDYPVASFKQEIFKNTQTLALGFVPSTKKNHIYMLEGENLNKEDSDVLQDDANNFNHTTPVFDETPPSHVTDTIPYQEAFQANPPPNDELNFGEENIDTGSHDDANRAAMLRGL